MHQSYLNLYYSTERLKQDLKNNFQNSEELNKFVISTRIREILIAFLVIMAHNKKEKEAFFVNFFWR